MLALRMIINRFLRSFIFCPMIDHNLEHLPRILWDFYRKISQTRIFVWDNSGTLVEHLWNLCYKRHGILTHCVWRKHQNVPRKRPEFSGEFSREFLVPKSVILWWNSGEIYVMNVIELSWNMPEKNLENFSWKPPEFSRDISREFLVAIIVVIWWNFGGIYVTNVIEFSCNVSEKNLENSSWKSPNFSREVSRKFLVAVIAKLWRNLRGKSTCSCHVGFHQMGWRGILVGPRGRLAG